MGQMLNLVLVPGSTAVFKRQILEQFEECIFSVIADDDSILIILKDSDMMPQIVQSIRSW
jgi:transcriptional regulator of arginine metabolism